MTRLCLWGYTGGSGGPAHAHAPGLGLQQARPGQAVSASAGYGELFGGSAFGTGRQGGGIWGSGRAVQSAAGDPAAPMDALRAAASIADDDNDTHMGWR